MLFKDYGYKEKVESIIKTLFIDLTREYRRGKYSVTNLDIMNRARKEIISDVEFNWTLYNMAELTGYSTSYFSELYSLYYGISPKADLINRRIEKAKNF